MTLPPRQRKILYRLLLAAVFIAVGLYVIDNLEQLQTLPTRFEWPYLVYGLVLTLFGHLAGYAIWLRIAACFDMKTSWWHTGKAWFLSRLGRYIPGKISLLLIRFNAYEGHSKTKISAATLIEAYTSVFAASTLLILFVASTPNTAAPSLTVALILTIILLGLSHPVVLQAALKLLARILPVPELYILPRQRDIFGFTGFQLVAMLLHGGALFMVFNAVGEVGPGYYLLITAAFFIAGLIGMLAVFAPSGIGVREAVLVILLAKIVDPATLIAGTIIIRLTGIVSELLLAGFFVSYAKGRNSRVQQG